MKAVYTDHEGKEIDEVWCDGQDCGVVFTTGIMVPVGVTDFEGKEVPLVKIFCSRECLDRWRWGKQ